MKKSMAQITQGGLYTKTGDKVERVEGTKPGGIGESAAAAQKPRKAKAKPKAKAKAKPKAKAKAKPKGKAAPASQSNT